MPAASAEAEPIAFPHKNWSDFRGILNVFGAFRSACLAQQVTRELPEQILPEDYQVVSSSLHALGFESGTEHKTVVLSKTGDEERDFAGGHAYIEMSFPTDAAPSGECRVAWKREWDYSKGVEDIMMSTAVLLDSWTSFELKAVRLSRPDDGFSVADQYGLVSEWAAPCFDSTWCRVNLHVDLRLEDGIHLAISRGEPPTASDGN
ncbi:hypothetical protein [uncultured Nitratireductor sp.]|uniref:hypothetical protein n=1 Tax=uncultured Nitratireductor sp. TaxID=520953 RepID=UPI0025D9EBDC|nr:hypothetical protein [uncultured Nitratireductor sp.]